MGVRWGTVGSHRKVHHTCALTGHVAVTLRAAGPWVATNKCTFGCRYTAREFICYMEGRALSTTKMDFPWCSQCVIGATAYHFNPMSLIWIKAQHILVVQLWTSSTFSKFAFVRVLQGLDTKIHIRVCHIVNDSPPFLILMESLWKWWPMSFLKVCAVCKPWAEILCVRFAYIVS